MKILFVGDIVGRGGIKVVSALLPKIVEQESVDLVIGNGENASDGGVGLTRDEAVELFGSGVHIITSGNHIWKKPGIVELLKQEERILRPANYPPGTPGRGSFLWQSNLGVEVGIINLAGRVFMDALDCPFRVGLQEYSKFKEMGTKVVVIDFHAEATSEKAALAWFLDGKVSALVGTHTHVQTADERILVNQTGFLTDAGMTGARDSVIGIEKEAAIQRFLTGVPQRFQPSKRSLMLNGVLVEVSEVTGRCSRIKRVNEVLPQAR